MAPHVGVLSRPGQGFLVLDTVEKRVKALCALSGRGQNLDCGLIRRRFLRTAIAEKRALRDLLPARDDGGPRLTLTSEDRRRSKRHGQDTGRGGVANRVVGSGEMSAGYVSRLVCDDSRDFVDVLDHEEQTGVDEYPLPPRDEGVEGAVVDDVDLHRACIEPGRREEWRGDLVNDMFGFRVADERYSPGTGRIGSAERKRANGRPAQGRQTRPGDEVRQIAGSHRRIER